MSLQPTPASPPPPYTPSSQTTTPPQEQQCCGKKFHWMEIAAAVVTVALVAVACVMLFSHIPSGVTYALFSGAGLIVIAGIVYKVVEYCRSGKKATPPPPSHTHNHFYPPPYPLDLHNYAQPAHFAAPR